MNMHPSHSRKVSLLLLALSLLSFTALLTAPLQGIFPARAGFFSDTSSVSAVSLVTQDFNGATPDVLAAGWYAENILTPGIIDATIATSGKEGSAYHTPAIAGDRSIGFYKTSDRNNLQDSFIRFTYTPTVPLTEIAGSFDFESTYGFWDASKPRQIGFSQDGVGTNAFVYSVNGAPQVEILDGAAIGRIDNGSVLASERRRWLSDAEMDALALSIRNIQFSLSGLNLAACDTLTLYWNSQEPFNLYEDMQVNIDNFALTGVIQSAALPVAVQVDDDWLGMPDCTLVQLNGMDYRVGVDAFATIQAGLDAVAAGGTVTVHPGSYTENLDIDHALTLTGSGLPVLDAAGSPAVSCVNADSAVVKGFNIDNAGTVFNLDGCTLSAYANNITDFNTPLVSVASVANLGHNWWGTSSPVGLTGTDEAYRLGAQVASWADSSVGDVSLGNASLDSLTNEGLGVIVSHGRQPAAAPFDDPGLSYGKRLCSDYYDIFLLGETTGEYVVRLIVDDTPECRTDSRSALNRDNLFIYNRLTHCWERVAAATHDAQSLYASLNASWLDGTPFVADAVDLDVFLPVMLR